jgi:purine-binding chemotaxis protein CheW
MANAGQEPVVGGAESPTTQEWTSNQPRTYDQPDLRVVVFRMAEHEYVVDAALVQEIVRLAELSSGDAARLMRVDGAPEYVEGVIKVGARIVPVVDLRRRLGTEERPVTAETCVIVAKLPIGLVGFLVDAVSEMMWVKTHDFQVPSPLVAGIDRIYVQGIAHLGKRLLVMLDLERVLTPDEQRELDVLRSPGAGARRQEGDVRVTLETLFSSQAEIEALEAAQAEASADLWGLVVFGLGDELYGVPIVDVAEVREPLPIMPLPNVSSHVLGLINLRGTVLPVLDLRQRFGLDLEPDGPESRLIVLKALKREDGTEGDPVALRVDRVHSLVRLPRVDFQSAPSGTGRVDLAHCAQVTVLDGRLLIELDVRALLADAGAHGEGVEPSSRQSG